MADEYERLLTVAQVATLLGVGDKTVRRIINEGGMIPVNIGPAAGQRKVLRIEESEVRAYMERSKRRSA